MNPGWLCTSEPLGRYKPLYLSITRRGIGRRFGVSTLQERKEKKKIGAEGAEGRRRRRREAAPEAPRERRRRRGGGAGDNDTGIEASLRLRAPNFPRAVCAVAGRRRSFVLPWSRRTGRFQRNFDGKDPREAQNFPRFARGQFETAAAETARTTRGGGHDRRHALRVSMLESRRVTNH